jgi:hypothetical protein
VRPLWLCLQDHNCGCRQRNLRATA